MYAQGVEWGPVQVLSTTARLTGLRTSACSRWLGEVEHRNWSDNENCDVFDGNHTVAVMERGILSDEQNNFVFSFESRRWRMTPQMFDETKGSAGVKFFKNDASGRFVEFGCGCGGDYRLRTRSRPRGATTCPGLV